MRKNGSFSSLRPRWNSRVHPVDPEPASVKQRQGKSSKFVEVTKSRKIHVTHYQPSVDRDNPETPEPGDQCVLFFIHGVGGAADIWIKQIDYFVERGYEIVAPDLLGHGLSSKPRQQEAYLFSELAKDVLFVFDLYSRRRNVLIGHSYGSSFCTLIARERLGCISKLVLISGGGPTTLSPDSCSAFCLPSPLFYCVRPSVSGMYVYMYVYLY